MPYRQSHACCLRRDHPRDRGHRRLRAGRERMRARQGATQPQSVQIWGTRSACRAAGWHTFYFHVRHLAALPSCRPGQLASPAPFEEGLDALCSAVSPVRSVPGIRSGQGQYSADSRASVRCPRTMMSWSLWAVPHCRALRASRAAKFRSTVSSVAVSVRPYPARKAARR